MVILEIFGGGCVTWMRSSALAAGSGARIGHRFTAGGDLQRGGDRGDHRRRLRHLDEIRRSGGRLRCPNRAPLHRWRWDRGIFLTFQGTRGIGDRQSKLFAPGGGFATS